MRAELLSVGVLSSGEQEVCALHIGACYRSGVDELGDMII